MSPQIRRTLGLIVRIVVALAAAVLLVLQALTEAKIFKDPQWLPVVLAAGIALTTLADNIRAAWRTVRAPEAEGARARVQKAMVSALVYIADKQSIDLQAIGASVFVVDRRLRWCKFPKCVRREFMLQRITRFRLNDYPQPSTVEWKRGKGAIGAVLRTRSYAHVHWAPIAKRHGGPVAITREKFDALPEKTKAGFSYEEFIGIVGKYAEILAVPIMSDGGGNILGVLSIDRPYEEGDTQVLLDKLEVRTAAETAAAAMRGELTKDLIPTES